MGMDEPMARPDGAQLGAAAPGPPCVDRPPRAEAGHTRMSEMSDRQPSTVVDPDPIVIVGMAIEAPGGVDTAADYWDFLSQRQEGLCPLPTDRGWPIRDLLTGSCREGFKRIHNCGGF
ncbi:hypothetical protein NIIDMKKI_16310 [Mycobacterium kansasii]|uniref:Beta-ketoacyl synthase-like N-terminal domain-containing protein n=1 Tax=Mycobacterium kansasii TaxID=1768 RepID=A0A7G1I9G9_MYCKA|nr:hypothetical protein NIIDMKKI_16310 [Mycobacterium kansasii]